MQSHRDKVAGVHHRRDVQRDAGLKCLQLSRRSGAGSAAGRRENRDIVAGSYGCGSAGDRCDGGSAKILVMPFWSARLRVTEKEIGVLENGWMPNNGGGVPPVSGAEGGICESGE